MAKLTAAQKKDRAAYQQLRGMYKQLNALEKKIAKKEAQWKGKKSAFAKKHQALLQRQGRLTGNDVDLRNLLGHRLTNHQEPDEPSIYDNVTRIQRRGGKPRAQVMDIRSLGLTKAEAMKELGGTTVKHLIKSSVEFTWVGSTEDATHRDNEEGAVYNKQKYSAITHNQRLVIPFRTYQRFAPYIALMRNKRNGVIPPGSRDHWMRVKSSISSFNGSHGVDEFVNFIDDYICPPSGGVEVERRPMETLIAIRNIHYFNMNEQEPQPIENNPFGFFAANQSHALIDHKITPSTTWTDNFIIQPQTPHQLVGFDAYCALEPLFSRIEPSAMGRKGGNNPVARGTSTFIFTLQYMVNIMYNWPDKKRDKFDRPVFLSPHDPNYVDVNKLPDLRTTLTDAARVFEFFMLTVTVYDEHKNVLWRHDPTRRATNWCKCIDFVARDGHLYLCAKRNESRSLIGSIHQIVRPFREPIRCSNRFIIPKARKENNDIVRILATGDYRTVPDLIASIVSTTDKSIVHIFMPSYEMPSQRGRKIKRYENDLEKLFFHLRHEKQFQCEIFSVRDRSMGVLKLQRFNRDGHAMTVSVQALSPTINSIEEEDALQGARDHLYRKIFTRPALSSLNASGLEWFQNAVGGLIGSLCPDIHATLKDKARVWEIDTKAQHPFALSQIEMIACYSIFDYVKKYDRASYVLNYGRAVEPYTSYYVEFYVPNHLFQDYGTCSGMELIEGYNDGDYTITHYFRPSRVIPSHIFLELAKFHETSTLPEWLTKLATMPICGTLGKQFNKSSNISYFKDAETALRHKKQYPGSIIFTHEVEDVTYYVVARELRSQLLEGFRPVYFQELGLARLSEWQKMKKISEKAIIVQVLTDSTRYILPDDAGLSQAVMDRQNKGVASGMKPGTVILSDKIEVEEEEPPKQTKEVVKKVMPTKEAESMRGYVGMEPTGPIITKVQTKTQPKKTTMKKEAEKMRAVVLDDAKRLRDLIDDEEVPKEEKLEVMNHMGLADQMVNKSLRYSDQVGGLKLNTVAVADVLGNGAPKHNLFDRYVPNIVVPPDTPVHGVYHPGAVGMWEARKAGHGCPYKAVMPKYTPTITTVDVHTYTLTDEFDVKRSVQEAKALLDKYGKVFIKAVQPGAGKSSLTKEISKDYKLADEGFRVINLSQYWETVQQYADIGDFKSLYSAFSVAFGG